MKIHLPPYEPLLKGNEHLRHGEINIDLGEDVVKIIRCKNCKFREDIEWCAIHGHKIGFNDFCSYGERKDAE